MQYDVSVQTGIFFFAVYIQRLYRHRKGFFFKYLLRAHDPFIQRRCCEHLYFFDAYGFCLGFRKYTRKTALIHKGFYIGIRVFPAKIHSLQHPVERRSPFGGGKPLRVRVKIRLSYGMGQSYAPHPFHVGDGHCSRYSCFFLIRVLPVQSCLYLRPKKRPILLGFQRVVLHNNGLRSDVSDKVQLKFRFVAVKLVFGVSPFPV